MIRIATTKFAQIRPGIWYGGKTQTRFSWNKEWGKNWTGFHQNTEWEKNPGWVGTHSWSGCKMMGFDPGLLY